MARGRPREFDKDEALRNAMLVFWQRGYRGTSVDDLTTALGINRPSLYAAFGDKESLFLQVIDYYRLNLIVPAAVRLLGSHHLRDGLENFFDALTLVVSGEKNPPGCMIACLLSEECCESEAIREKLSSLIETSDRSFTKLFEQHREQLVGTLTAQAAAKLLLSTVHGIAIRARSGASKQTLLEIGEAFLNTIIVPEQN